jgi:hypothetical protein
MKAMICLFISLIFNTLTFSGLENKKVISDTIKEVWIYDYFENRGYTVGSAYRQFEELEKGDVFKFKVDSLEISSLQNILSTSDIQKQFYGKLGKCILFTEIITNDDKVLKIAILNDMIIDYTGKNGIYKYYMIKERKYQEWLLKFREKVLSSSSCTSKKGVENCKIKEVLKVTSEKNDSYYMQVKFSNCASKELREILVKEELRNRFPLIGNKTIYMEEHLGKIYNEYKYEIKVK